MLCLLSLGCVINVQNTCGMLFWKLNKMKGVRDLMKEHSIYCVFLSKKGFSFVRLSHRAVCIIAASGQSELSSYEVAES